MSEPVENMKKRRPSKGKTFQGFPPTNPGWNCDLSFMFEGIEWEIWEIEHDDSYAFILYKIVADGRAPKKANYLIQISRLGSLKPTRDALTMLQYRPGMIEVMGKTMGQKIKTGHITV